jgi:hypothetical protein
MYVNVSYHASVVNVWMDVWFIGYVLLGKSFQLVIIIRSNQTLHAGKIQTFIIHMSFHNSVCVCVCVCDWD